MDTHTMQLVKTLPSGAGLYHCPVCGREIVIGIEPNDYCVITQGDITAQHTGGDVVLGLTITQDDERLRPFADYMNRRAKD